MSEMQTTKHTAQIREGIVFSNKMKKTITVEVPQLVKHEKFKKYIHRKVRYVAHDEKSEAKLGDKVQIAETRPFSKTKRWKLVKVLS